MKHDGDVAVRGGAGSTLAGQDRVASTPSVEVLGNVVVKTGQRVYISRNRGTNCEIVTDSSDASFQRAFMSISGLYPVKALYTQGVRTPISSKASTSASMAIGPYSSTCASAASVWGSQKVIAISR